MLNCLQPFVFNINKDSLWLHVVEKRSFFQQRFPYLFRLLSKPHSFQHSINTLLNNLLKGLFLRYLPMRSLK